MHDEEEISSVIGCIYDASLDPTLWPEALKMSCGYVGGIAGALQLVDMVQKNGRFYYSWGDDPYYTRLYFDKYLKLNPILSSMLSVQAGNVVSISTLIPYEEFLASRLHKEWAQPQGYVDSITACVDKTATSSAAITIARHERHGLVDEAAFQRMRLLAPHFQRAVGIGKLIHLQKVEAAALADTLDGIEASLLLVDAEGCIIHMNAAARRLLDEAAILRALGGKLTAIDADVNRRLKEAFLAAAAGDASMGERGMAVPLSAGKQRHWVAHVLPLTSGARRKAGAVYSAVAAVFVHTASLDLDTPIELMTQLYQLTPAELRTLFAIVAGSGIADAAAILGVSQTTARTHLQSVFNKTGVRRQADLVKLVAGLASPLFS